jgi:hypothetical protein
VTPGGAPFDQRGVLAALEREYVAYVLIGGLARVLRGADETTDGVDLCPSLREDNLQRLQRALAGLGIEGEVPSSAELRASAPLTLETSLGTVKVVGEPAGTRKGYNDVRRAATREHLGQGLRPSVASVADLGRMAAALGREQDLARLPELRRILELEVTLQRGLGLER